MRVLKLFVASAAVLAFTTVAPSTVGAEGATTRTEVRKIDECIRLDGLDLCFEGQVVEHYTFEPSGNVNYSAHSRVCSKTVDPTSGQVFSPTCGDDNRHALIRDGQIYELGIQSRTTTLPRPYTCTIRWSLHVVGDDVQYDRQDTVCKPA